VGVAGIGAGADLDAIALEGGDVIEGLLEREVREDCGEDADFHEDKTDDSGIGS